MYNARCMVRFFFSSLLSVVSEDGDAQAQAPLEQVRININILYRHVRVA
jgi:hypothetical protein